MNDTRRGSKRSVTLLENPNNRGCTRRLPEALIRYSTKLGSLLRPIENPLKTRVYIQGPKPSLHLLAYLNSPGPKNEPKKTLKRNLKPNHLHNLITILNNDKKLY